MFLLLIFISVAALYASRPSEESLRRYESRIAETGSRGDSLDRELRIRRSLVDSLRATEGQELAILHELEAEIELGQRIIAILQEDEELLLQRVALLTDTIASLEELRLQRHAALMRRLQVLQRYTPPSFWEILLTGGSPTEALRYGAAVRQLTASDRAVLASYISLLDEISLRQMELLLEQQYLLELQEEERIRLEEVSQRADERRELIGSIRGERGRWESAVREMEVARRELNELVATLRMEKERIADQLARLTKKFSEGRGRTPWPVRGPVVAPFGRVVHPQYQTVTFNRGIAIGAKRGEAVRVVAPGVVSFSGTLRGYGNLVIVEHFGGYSTIYAHLQESGLKVGDELQSGDLVGLVGESGSLEGVRLHFEIRHRADALDPLQWLLPVN